VPPPRKNRPAGWHSPASTKMRRNSSRGACYTWTHANRAPSAVPTRARTRPADASRRSGCMRFKHMTPMTDCGIVRLFRRVTQVKTTPCVYVYDDHRYHGIVPKVLFTADDTPWWPYTQAERAESLPPLPPPPPHFSLKNQHRLLARPRLTLLNFGTAESQAALGRC